MKLKEIVESTAIGIHDKDELTEKIKEYVLHVSEQAINEVRDDHVAAISRVAKEKSYEFSKIVNKVSDDCLLKIKDLLKEAT